MPPSGRRRIVVAGAGLAIVVVAIAVVAIASGGGTSNASATSPVSSTSTVVIKRQDLIETDDEDGTLGYADSRDVVNHVSGYVTWLPPEGDVIRPGGTLYKVDGTPVILFSGRVPAYRTLSASSSSSGRDVLQLEQNLRALGFDPNHAMTVNGTWSSATTAAVERWQKQRGLNQTGSIGLGRIVFQPGARRVATLDTTLGGSSTSGSSGGASGASNQGASATAADTLTLSDGVYRTPAQLRTVATGTGTDTTTTTTPTPTQTTTTTTPTPTPTTTTPAPAKKKPATAKTPTTTSAAASKAKTSTAKTSTSAAQTSSASGAASTPSNTIMTTTSTRKVVTVKLDTTKSSLAKKGALVDVQLPSGQVTRARIGSVGKVATATSSSSSSNSNSATTSSGATITLTIPLNTHGGGLDQAPVTVKFEQNRVKNVLSIPVTALIARPGGRFAVEVVSGGSRRLVPVTPGVYTSGDVQIDGAGLAAGMRVTNSAVT